MGSLLTPSPSTLRSGGLDWVQRRQKKDGAPRSSRDAKEEQERLLQLLLLSLVLVHSQPSSTLAANLLHDQPIHHAEARIHVRRLRLKIIPNSLKLIPLAIHLSVCSLSEKGSEIPIYGQRPNKRTPTWKSGAGGNHAATMAEYKAEAVPEPKEIHNFRTYMVAVLMCMGAAAYGYDTG